MSRMFNTTIRTVAFVALAGFSLSACATRQYVDEQNAATATRIQALEARVQEVAGKADSAGQRADAAAAEARTASQRLDQLEGRVGQLEKAPARRPRG
jgi:outer membrane murein-binding lipoprotein Lpp